MFSDLKYRLRALLRRDSMERELTEELQFHLDQDARIEARGRANFGGIEQVKEACRDERGIGALDRLRQDLRYAWRMFVKHPGFTAAVVSTLGLGIGGATTMFGIVDGVLLKPLPYRDADRIVRVGRNFGGVRVSATSAVDYDALATQTQTLAAVAVARTETVDVAGGAAGPLRVDAAVVSSSFFAVLGVPPERGQVFSAADDRPGSRQVAVVSEPLARRIGAAAEPGGSILINGQPHLIAAVMPRRFRGPEALNQQNVDLWLPLGRLKPSADGDDAAFGTLAAARAGIEMQTAMQEVDQIGRRLAEAGGNSSGPPRFWVAALRDETIRDAASGLWLVFGAVSLLLLLACTNVANLFLVRATERSREIALRAALGAGRGRIARQLITETMLYAGAGGLLGAGLSYIGVALVRAWAPADLPRINDLQVDVRVLLFAFAVAMISGLVFGAGPAWRARRTNFTAVLRGSSTATAGRPQLRQRALLVVVQTAMAAMLVAGAALLANSLRHLSNVDPGFDPSNVAWLDLSLPERSYPGAAPKIAFFDELLRRTRSLPGLESIAVVQGRPLGGGNSIASVAAEGRLPANGEQPARVPFHVVSPGYFQTMRIPILDGRDFSESDRATSERMAVVSRAFADRFWPGERAVGRRFWMGRIAADAPFVEVAGVVEDVRQYALADEPIPMVYRALAQTPRGSATVVARHGADGVTAAVDQLRAAAAALDSALPLDRHGTLSTDVTQSIREPRFRALALSAFAALACGIACVGLYGALAWLVRARHREFGVRVALGASPDHLRWVVLRRGLMLAAAGVAIGIAGALAGSRLMTSMLFGIGPTDVPTFATAGAVLLIVAAGASWIPARRAARVDPLVILNDQ